MWRVASASVVGTSHAVRGEACQDAHVVTTVSTSRDGEVLVAVASDGAGSASSGGEGAALVCKFFRDHVVELLHQGGALADITAEQGASWLASYRSEIEHAVGPERVRDFASTLLLSAVGRETGAFFQVGDGAMAVRFADGPDTYDAPFWPERGEYANTTFFVTDPSAASHLRTERIDRPISEVALFTDGVEGLALRFVDTTVHDPFFQGVFPPVRSAAGPGPLSPALSDALTTFLGSDRVNARTDDDKTLVLACRVGASPNAP